MKSDRFFSWDLWTAAWSLPANLWLWFGETRQPKPVLFLVKVEINVITKTTGWKNALLGVCLSFEFRFGETHRQRSGWLLCLWVLNWWEGRLLSFLLTWFLAVLPLLLSHFSPLVSTGLTKRHPNKTVLMCPDQFSHVLYLIKGMHRKQRGWSRGEVIGGARNVGSRGNSRKCSE